MCQVVLIRAGATIYDEQNRVQGILDIPLSESGQGEVARMAQALAESLNGSPLSALYCGPGENVIRTAEIVGKTLAVRPSESTTSAISTRACGKGCRSTTFGVAIPSYLGSGSKTPRRSVHLKVRRSRARWDGSRRHFDRCSSDIMMRRSDWLWVNRWSRWFYAILKASRASILMNCRAAGALNASKLCECYWATDRRADGSHCPGSGRAREETVHS